MSRRRRKQQKPSFSLGVLVGGVLFVGALLAWKVSAPLRHDLAVLTAAFFGW